MTAGVECVTTNLRRPQAKVSRQESGRQYGTLSSRLSAPSNARSAASGKAPAAPHPQPSVVGSSPVTSQHPSDAEDAVSDGVEGHALPQSPPASPLENCAVLPVFLQGHGSNYSEVLRDWLEMVLYRLGVRAAWAASLALTRSFQMSGVFVDFILCPFPGPEAMHRAADLFISGPNVLFPVLREETLLSLLHVARSNGPVGLIRQAGHSSLMQAYLALLLGSLSNGSTDAGLGDFDVRSCLSSCTTLMAHALHETSLATVQAMLLLSMAYRCCNDVMGAWNATGLAVSIANSNGVLRRRHGPSTKDMSAAAAERALAWKATWMFEKTLAFELGRPSITGSRASVIQASAETFSASDRPRHEIEAAKANEDLTVTLDAVGRSCIALGRRADRTDLDHNAAIYDKIKTTRESVTTLMDWARRVPYVLR